MQFRIQYTSSNQVISLVSPCFEPAPTVEYIPGTPVAGRIIRWIWLVLSHVQSTHRCLACRDSGHRDGQVHYDTWLHAQSLEHSIFQRMPSELFWIHRRNLWRLSLTRTTCCDSQPAGLIGSVWSIWDAGRCSKWGCLDTWNDTDVMVGQRMQQDMSRITDTTE